MDKFCKLCFHTELKTIIYVSFKSQCDTYLPSIVRVDLYQALMNYVAGSDQEIDHTGDRFILPSSFIGSPRAT